MRVLPLRKRFRGGFHLAGLVLGAAATVSAALAQPSLADRASLATAVDGSYVRWREHVVDDEARAGFALRGSDGLVMADLDQDSHLDIVSVHESDDEYDGRPEGHIRIAFGSADPDRWVLATLAEGPEAGGAEDVAVGDVDGDGDPDLLAACELAHLIYFENPGATARQPETWQRIIPRITLDRGSFIRAFLGDIDGDGRPDPIAANKGVQDHAETGPELREISWFRLTGPALRQSSWEEQILKRIEWPINARPVDLDGDGDLDVIGGSVAEARVIWLQNEGKGQFVEHRMDLTPGRGMAADAQPATVGFNMDFADLDGDDRLDIVTFDTPPLLGHELIWLQQPARPGQPWAAHRIGGYGPDTIVGVALADIDGDGDPDVMTGGYSRGSRAEDGQAAADTPLGRLAWFENPGRTDADWTRHDISRRERGMFDKFIPQDMDGDGDIDFVGTRGNSGRFDGVFWLEQVRGDVRAPVFEPARDDDSPEVPLPAPE